MAVTVTPETPINALTLPSKPDIESSLTVGLEVYPDPPAVICTFLMNPEVKLAVACAFCPKTDPR